MFGLQDAQADLARERAPVGLFSLLAYVELFVNSIGKRAMAAEIAANLFRPLCG